MSKGCAGCGGCGRVEARHVPLSDSVLYGEESIVSRTILENSAGGLTLFAFDKGQALSEHTTPFDAVVHVLEGAARVTVGEESYDVGAGEIVIMPANVPHSVSASQRFKMLLTMLRGPAG